VSRRRFEVHAISGLDRRGELDREEQTGWCKDALYSALSDVELSK
jgi:hypothetical protein